MDNMKSMKSFLMGLLAVVAMQTAGLSAEENKPLYENNFEKAEVDKVPDEFLVLDGGFVVKQDGANKLLELPGAPVESFGVLFGPTEKSDIAVSARIKGTNKGRRFPTFGVGLNGQGGYKLQVSPAKKALELYKGDDLAATVPFEWKAGEWTMMQLRVRKTGDAAWKIEGKAWPQGGTEPKDWTISFDETKEPPAGRAAIWGQPYATTPIQYDDLLVTRAK